MILAHQALEWLKRGNARFVSGDVEASAFASPDWREALVHGQQPFAIILGCSDSRVPVETIFDQGPGDLFVVRVAGNVVTPAVLGSIEYAVEQFGTQLVVVLGHSNCGAVHASLSQLQTGGKHPSKNLSSILKQIRRALKTLPPKVRREDPAAIMDQAVQANILQSAEQLRKRSKILDGRVEKRDLQIVTGQYSIESGTVEFHESD